MKMKRYKYTNTYVTSILPTLWIFKRHLLFHNMKLLLIIWCYYPLTMVIFGRKVTATDHIFCPSECMNSR